MSGALMEEKMHIMFYYEKKPLGVVGTDGALY
jgi:hypothetical protein